MVSAASPWWMSFSFGFGSFPLILTLQSKHVPFPFPQRLSGTRSLPLGPFSSFPFLGFYPQFEQRVSFYVFVPSGYSGYTLSNPFSPFPFLSSRDLGFLTSHPLVANHDNMSSGPLELLVSCPFVLLITGPSFTNCMPKPFTFKRTSL